MPPSGALSKRMPPARRRTSSVPSVEAPSRTRCSKGRWVWERTLSRVASIVARAFRTTVTTVTGGPGAAAPSGPAVSFGSGTPSSDRAGIAEQTDHRQGEDPQVEAHRPVLDVVEVVF